MSKPVVEACHRMKGRVRLRIVEGPRNEQAVVGLGERLAALPDVHEVRANVRTASMLVLFEGTAEPFLAAIADADFLTLRPFAPHAPMRRLKHAIGEADQRLREETGGVASMGSLAFFAFVGAAVYQTSRGKFLPAGMALVRFALEAMEREAEQELSRRVAG